MYVSDNVYVFPGCVWVKTKEMVGSKPNTIAGEFYKLIGAAAKVQFQAKWCQKDWGLIDSWSCFESVDLSCF